jgi:hypothetical protein
LEVELLLETTELTPLDELRLDAVEEELFIGTELALDALEFAADEIDEELNLTPSGAGWVFTKTDFTGDQLSAESPTLTP